MNHLLLDLIFVTSFLLSPIPHNDRLIVIAHRGDHTHAPENSLKAFADAIQTGVDYVEVDVRTTSDGYLIVMHDATIDRMTNGKGKVRELKFSDIKMFSIIDKDETTSSHHPVPSFADVLSLCSGETKIYLDFKDASALATWNLIRFHKMEKSVVVYINSKAQYADWRAVAPDVPLIVSLPDSVTNEKTLSSFLSSVDAEILDGNAGQYSEKMIRLANDHRRQVWVDVQEKNESPEKWTAVLSLGVNGMQTDHPDELLRWLRSINR